ncbi:hypothetical protein [Methylopila sp. 73B]|uniref:hypothetical protein n=1 Tax=Methylopila sp. 73B TaxID=1120792 RepID=UPI0012DC4856|nr:hypothetical protein [Methylopila sp. 73B]
MHFTWHAKQRFKERFGRELPRDEERAICASLALDACGLPAGGTAEYAIRVTQPSGEVLRAWLKVSTGPSGCVITIFRPGHSKKRARDKKVKPPSFSDALLANRKQKYIRLAKC